MTDTDSKTSETSTKEVAPVESQARLSSDETPEKSQWRCQSQRPSQWQGQRQ